jgi:hypothetical protein
MRGLETSKTSDEAFALLIPKLYVETVMPSKAESITEQEERRNGVRRIKEKILCLPPFLLFNLVLPGFPLYLLWFSGPL